MQTTAHGLEAFLNARGPFGFCLFEPLLALPYDFCRLHALGDIHGDFAQAMKALELSKCMDSEGKWVGGTAVLVQVGDILVRGDNELAIMRKFQKLAKEAKEAGGEVVVMNGAMSCS